MSMSRSRSRHTHNDQHRPRSPSPPSQTFHPSILPHSVPTPALVESVAGAAHYAGAPIDPSVVLKHRRSSSGDTPGAHTMLEHAHERVLADLTELYCCRPTVEIFNRSWRKDAEYEGHYCKCKGSEEIMAQWFALAKLCTSSEQISKRIMSSTQTPNRLIYHQVQEYTVRFWKKKKRVESVIVLDLDEEDRIVRMVDQWNGQQASSHVLASLLRSLAAKITPWLVHVPKS